jgi:hypothetical protein
MEERMLGLAWLRRGNGEDRDITLELDGLQACLFVDKLLKNLIK